MPKYFMGGTRLGGLERLMMDPSRSGKEPRRYRPPKKPVRSQPPKARSSGRKEKGGGV